MPGHAGAPQYRLEAAAEYDWPWLIDAQVEMVWENLSSNQREMGLPAVRERIFGLIDALRGRERRSIVLLARGDRGAPIGFLWVQEIMGEATGQPEAFVLAIYVAKPYRRNGVGKRLLEAGDEWARSQNIGRIALSVDAPNAAARRLYEAVGYGVEKVRMAKSTWDADAP